MASSVPIQIAETIQTAHINRAPSPSHDLNPSTAASEKEPVTLEPAPTHDDLDDDELDDYIPRSVVNPKPRTAKLPPMPDLRFEQSYLNSISKADTWGRVAWITARDQVMMPLIQGVVYNLFLIGWHHWNKNAQVHGSSIGARVRRWWYGVNNWQLPPQKSSNWRTAFTKKEL
ncbi:hypothetical protein HER10_EVM0011488 [Colletotrichum scovillei]|uniref:DUF1770-domain-containing protein n=2 Tax=Colletotrichum acutatum species complex TaxID=2707335 RepID=A0A9P7R7X1_9PEZI|nr:uncharacterized protein HER10_EVM0011488 [Colletotrichum scovillei]KXH51662.1 hypothetical protein CNYM01_06785 [Colletotrichum nymphaeae SA-01]KAF4783584.1 hypothetical protein HER10_EVM0011488 [Colletotrichum scovillei]KAG7051796.1 DUF1770-domain-containing protein [Colletotrichum scovillei]KAG7070831.1 DUF1770-domain-containing protein [Colletotrichum scovillei]KAG7079100.1 DUF1770-domain-containing protein [Colletotrichum scovillei]